MRERGGFEILSESSMLLRPVVGSIRTAPLPNKVTQPQAEHEIATEIAQFLPQIQIATPDKVECRFLATTSSQ